MFIGEGCTLPLSEVNPTINRLFTLSESRGKEASGIAVRSHDAIYVLKEPVASSQLLHSPRYSELFRKSTKTSVPYPLSLIGHSRLVTNGTSELNANNQPVAKDGAVMIHNGIIVNDQDLWQEYPALKKNSDLDTEVLVSLLQHFRNGDGSIIPAVQKTFREIKGSASVATLFTDLDVAFLGTNTGSLFFTTSDDKKIFIFASERYILKSVMNSRDLSKHFSHSMITQVMAGNGYIIDLRTLENYAFPLTDDMEGHAHPDVPMQDPIPIVDLSPSVEMPRVMEANVLRPDVKKAMLETWEQVYSGGVVLKRCTRCLLPETLPFITFDDEGVCNHCRTFEKRGTIVKGEKALEEYVDRFRRTDGYPDCVIGFSGGRDSSYGLFYVKNHLKLNPLTFIYDWGMVTDLARRNQARVCGTLGIEQIVISADIKKKRDNIRKNLEAWLKKPELGMVPILMAGDKEFYHYFHKVREENAIRLFVFCGGYEGEESTGIFKLGFCGVDRSAGDKDAEFRMTGISLSDKLKMLLYYAKNFLTNPSYINSSIPDTLFAFYASYLLPDDYVYLFNYLEWDEETIITTIRKEFDWELEKDTVATWRTDDGTAALYNYIYLTMVGFTEFDTIRSHQVREGKLTRDEAMKLVREENKPRFDSIEWYAQAVGVDVNRLISTINSAPKNYSYRGSGRVP